MDNLCNSGNTSYESPVTSSCYWICTSHLYTTALKHHHFSHLHLHLHTLNHYHIINQDAATVKAFRTVQTESRQVRDTALNSGINTSHANWGRKWILICDCDADGLWICRWWYTGASGTRACVYYFNSRCRGLGMNPELETRTYQFSLRCQNRGRDANTEGVEKHHALIWVNKYEKKTNSWIKETKSSICYGSLQPIQTENQKKMDLHHDGNGGLSQHEKDKSKSRYKEDAGKHLSARIMCFFQALIH